MTRICCAASAQGFPQVDSSAMERTRGSQFFVGLARWNAECLTKRNESAEISWERMRTALRLLDQQSSWSPCGDPFPNKPTPHGDPQISLSVTNLFPRSFVIHV